MAALRAAGMEILSDATTPKSTMSSAADAVLNAKSCADRIAAMLAAVVVRLLPPLPSATAAGAAPVAVSHAAPAVLLRVLLAPLLAVTKTGARSLKEGCEEAVTVGPALCEGLSMFAGGGGGGAPGSDSEAMTRSSDCISGPQLNADWWWVEPGMDCEGCGCSWGAKVCACWA